MPQVEGLIGRGVDAMIRRAVRKTFRMVHWLPPEQPILGPAILVANHHGWHDGYVMYHAVTKLDLLSLDWIAEFDAFPLFAKVGGMPFPPTDPARRAVTIRQTIRRMREENRSLILFAEGTLHRPPSLMPFGKSLELVAGKVPGVQVIPVGIQYDMSMHERPEGYLSFGKPVALGEQLCHRTRMAVQVEMTRIAKTKVAEPELFQVLAKGTLDVNERWDMRRIKRP